MTEPANNPYGAPGARLEDPAAVAPGFSFRVALLAGCAGFGAAYLLGSIVSPLGQHWLVGSGVAAAQLYSEFMNSVALNLIGQGLNALAGVLAGYLAARYARSAPQLHAVAATIPFYLAVVAGYFGVYPPAYPGWAVALTFLLPIPCALIGARVWHRAVLHR